MALQQKPTARQLTETFSTMRLTSTVDAAPSSTGHAFQVGPTTGQNVIIDVNEVMSRNNNVGAELNFNAEGGNVTMFNNTAVPITFYSADGRIVASGDVTAFSDARLKKDIIPITRALEMVSNMRGVYYNRIDRPEETRGNVGVIAQDIEHILPQVVHTNEDGMKSVAYGNIVAVLIEAIKEQQEQLDELKAKLGA